jgi:hypothetical protein
MMDIADAVSILRFSFAGDPGTMRCEDAGDASDDGAIDIQDAILLLNYLFKGGPPPSRPLKGGSGGMLWAGCGTDPTADGLGCRFYGASTP